MTSPEVHTTSGLPTGHPSQEFERPVSIHVEDVTPQPAEIPVHTGNELPVPTHVPLREKRRDLMADSGKLVLSAHDSHQIQNEAQRQLRT